MSAANTGSIYKWKVKCSGLKVSDAKLLTALEGENDKLKKWLAEAMFDNAMYGNTRREDERPSLICGPVFEVSERRECKVLGADRTSCAIAAAELMIRSCAHACENRQ
jgi:hypothetical protein